MSVRGGVIFTFLLCFASTLRAQEPAVEKPAVEKPVVEKLVVLPFQADSRVEKRKIEVLDEVILVELNKYKPGAIAIISGSDVAALVGLEQQRQIMDCNDTSCLAEIGSALGASHLLVLSLAAVGSQFIITSKVINTTDARVPHRKITYTDVDEDALLGGIRETAQQIAGSLGWESTEVAAASASASDLEETTASTTQSASSSGAEEGDGEMNALLWSGVGLAGAGVLALAGLELGAVAVDATVVGDGALPIDERQAAADNVKLMAGGGLAGLVVAGVGVALIVVSLL